MRAGSLDRRITIQRKTVTLSESGASVEVWANLSMRAPAAMYPVKGDERFVSPEKVAEEQIEFRIRYSSTLADLSPQDRILHPALTADQAADPEYVVPDRFIHDVLAVAEIGRREGLKIITRRRADVMI